MTERIDRTGQHKTAFRKNKKIILATQEVCAICGALVDKDLKAPDPLSPTVDHIIPIAKGGHPSSLDNLQLAHRWCNLHKGDRLFVPGMENGPDIKNTLGQKNNPAHKRTTGPEKSPGLKNTKANQKAGHGQEPPEDWIPAGAEIDNNDLPLHADWGAVTW